MFNMFMIYLDTIKVMMWFGDTKLIIIPCIVDEFSKCTKHEANKG